MGSSIAFAAAYAALAIQSAAVQSGPERLNASSPWTVRKMERMCTVGRDFSTPGKPLTLGIKPGLFSEHMRMAVIVPATDEPLARGEAQVSFDGRPQVTAPFFEHVAKNMGARGTVIDLKEADLGPMKTAKEMRVQAGKLDVVLALSSVPEAMKAVDTCQKDLLAGWGMDPTTVDSIARWPQPVGGLASIFSHTDYPAIAIRNREQGVTDVRFWVSKQGKARDCKVIESSGSALLDAQACAIISKRGRFEPARTKGGEAVESISFQRVRWELPR